MSIIAQQYVKILTSLMLLLLLALAATTFGGAEQVQSQSAATESGYKATDKPVDQLEIGSPPVEYIVKNTNRAAYYQGKDGRARVSMTITDAQGRTRQRVFTILRYDEPLPEKAGNEPDADIGQAPSKESQADLHCGDQRIYVYFHLPADVNKMVFMVWKHLQKDDDRWLYLPALDLVKRIAATDKRSSFVGSNFFYEDVSGRNTEADVHELIKTTDDYYVLKNTPKKTEEVEFAYYIMWIHQKTFLPIKIEYYDAKNRIYRVYQALKVETIQGYPTVVQAKMEDLHAQTQTLMAYSDVKYNIDLPADIFTERYLRRPPQEYLR